MFLAQLNSLHISSHLHSQQLCKVGTIVIFITDEETAS